MFKSALTLVVLASATFTIPSLARTAISRDAKSKADTFDAAVYIDQAIAIVKNNALFAERVDWPQLHAQLHAEGDGAATSFDLYPLLVSLVRSLGDHHSFLQLSAERHAAYRSYKGSAFRYPPDPSPLRVVDRRFVGRAGPAPSDRIVERRRIRSVIVSGTTDNAPAALRSYAAALHHALSAGPPACGYVVDLRGNTGGNMMPMIAGLSVLLGDGMVGGFAAREGMEAWIIRGSRLFLRSAQGRDQLAIDVPKWKPLAAARQSPVALLIDSATASSGEMVAVAFAGRTNMRVFGRHSFGVSTSTSGHLLADGANLVIVDGQVRDRAGRDYPDGFGPDVDIDPALAPVEAARWVAERCSG